MAESDREEKVKETLDQDQLKEVLKSWLTALENNHDLELQLKGKTFSVPVVALTAGVAKVEFEGKEDAVEFEVELKWKK